MTININEQTTIVNINESINRILHTYTDHRGFQLTISYNSNEEEKQHGQSRAVNLKSPAGRYETQVVLYENESNRNSFYLLANVRGAGEVNVHQVQELSKSLNHIPYVFEWVENTLEQFGFTVEH